MISELLLILKSTVLLAYRLLQAVPAEGWQHAWKRLPLFILIWLLYALLNLTHLIGHLLDELLFSAYRKVAIKQPVFIVGIPRSGTTLLQRILAEDEDFTTLQTWEALFAPSVSERYFYSVIGKLLSPFAGLMIHIRKKLFSQMDQIHEIRIKAAEEDFLLLLPLEACFLLVLLCPNAEHYWRLAGFDRAEFSQQKSYQSTVLNYYKRCLQKHLFYHGAELRLLSKNPSFTPFVNSLEESFPDAIFIACVRPPEEVIPSQLNSLRPAMHVLSDGRCNRVFEERLVAALKGYYEIVNKQLAQENFTILPLKDLKNSLQETILKLCADLHMPVTDKFRRGLAQHDLKAKAYRSHYPEQLSALSLEGAEIKQKFSVVWPLPELSQGKVS